MSFPDILGHTGAYMAGENYLAEAGQGAAGGRCLVEDINAVGIPLDHSLDSPDLSLDPAEPVDQILIFLLGTQFSALPTAARIRGGSFRTILHPLFRSRQFSLCFLLRDAVQYLLFLISHEIPSL